jgi:ribosomal protein L11 methyltransferase
LGLASLSLGADAVLAADTDSLAIRATAGNRSLNHCSEKRLEVALGSVETLQALLAGRRADLLLCNILAPVIEALSPGFESLIAPQGRGLLSGLLVDQAPRLKEVLATQGWQVTQELAQGRWGLLEIRHT